MLPLPSFLLLVVPPIVFFGLALAWWLLGSGGDASKEAD